jgi:multiple sugar transport system substrate-binding protein
VKISFTAPSATYNEGLQLLLKENGTDDMPDVSFVALNLLRVLAEKKLGVDLTPLIAADAKLKQEGFSDHLLSLAKWKDRQVGLAFAASDPIFYYNADLVRKAGGDPDHMPADWDGLISLGARINAPDQGVVGMAYYWGLDDWMFQALVYTYGGTMLSPDEKTVAFDGPAGLAGIRLLDRIVRDGKMPPMNGDAMKQSLTAGKLGMFFWSSGALRSIINGVGDKFTLRTAPLPAIPGIEPHLPTGGNAVVMFTTDPKKQAVVYDFMKFAAGPYGASVVVPGTGYVPTNELAASDDRYLKTFYKDNPLFLAAVAQMPKMVPWYAYPGSNGVEIQKAIVNHLAEVVEQKVTPDAALKSMATEVQALLPK